MNKKTSIILSVSLLFTLSISASEMSTNENAMLTIVKNYHAIEQKMKNGHKVRVIASAKGIKKIAPRSQTVPQGFTEARTKLAQLSLNTQREIPRLGLFVLEVDSHALKDMVDSGRFEYIVEDTLSAPSLIESIALINADKVHLENHTGSEPLSTSAIAILDTGIDSSHPFLSGRVVEEACFSSNTSWSTSLCPNGLSTDEGPGSGIDCTSTGISSCSHGTHVAGIAAGYSENMSGVAPAANLISVQVFSEFHDTACGQVGTSCILSHQSDQIAALDWILSSSQTSNITAVNMSLGGGEYDSACDGTEPARTALITALRNLGIATVISSGNDGYTDAVSAPGCISSAVTVGSTLDYTDEVSSFSNSAEMIDLLAPGSSITSSVPGGGYATKQGTSMAAPHVSGAFAVLMAMVPGTSVDLVEKILKENAVFVTDYRNGLIHPRIDLDAASEAILKPSAILDHDSYSIIINRPTEFTAYNSTDPRGLDLHYVWDFGDFGSDISTDPITTHAYSKAGRYDLTLSVFNAMDDDDEVTVPVTVYDPAVISIITAPPPGI